MNTEPKGSMSDANAPSFTAATLTRTEAAAMLGNERTLLLAEWFVQAYEQGYRPHADEEYAAQQYRGLAKLLGSIR